VDRGPWSVTVTVTVTVTVDVIDHLGRKLRDIAFGGAAPQKGSAKVAWLVAVALRLERPTGVGPLERLGQHVVEVADEGDKPIAQFVERREAGSFE
jgi:hypothetical protein